MKINLFYSHDLQQRMDIINHSGEFIMLIKQYRFYVSLYIVENQFVEVYFNTQKRTIEEIEVLDSNDERLNLYASNIDIAELF